MDVRAMVHAWFNLLADFLDFFKNEELDKLAATIREQIAKSEEE